MSYDLTFWVGPEPEDDDAASGTYARLMDALEDDDLEPPTSEVLALVADLEARWPIDAADAPWASWPLIDDASGGTLYVNLVYGRPDEDIAFMAAAAAKHGLVCYDPQLEEVL